MNPELKINHLYNSVLQLLNSVGNFMEEDFEESEEHLQKVLRKLAISKALYDHNVIAVSGLQGVGKSTLMKNFYDLDSHILPIVAGRGERIPILLSEHASSETKTQVTMMEQDSQKRWHIKDEDIDAEKLAYYAQGDEANVLMLKIQVPYKHFNNQFSSFLILPGFEGNGDDYWETLIEYSLTCSSAMIFALNESKLADGYNQDKLTSVLEDFKGTKPIFALTFSDQSSDENQELKTTFMNRFNIPEEDRVIRVGAFNTDRNKTWIEDLKNSIEKYCYISPEFRTKQLKTLNRMLRIDLKRTLKKIREDIPQSDHHRENRRIEEVLQYFDQEREKLSKAFKKSLHASLDQMEAECFARAQDTVIRAKFTDKVKALFSGKSLKEQQKMNQTLLSLLYPDQGLAELDFDNVEERRSVIEQSKVLAYRRMVSDNLGITYQGKPEEASFKIQSVNNDYDLIEKANHENEGIIRGYLMTPSTVNDLQLLCIEGHNEVSLENKDFADSIRMIPVIASMNLAIAHGVPDQGLTRIQMDMNSPQFKQWDVLSRAPRSLANGFAAVAGVDMVDGVPNITMGIAQAIGIKLSLGMASAITGVVAGGALTIQLLKQININDINNFSEYIQAIRGLREKQEVAYQEEFEDYMDLIRDRLQRRLKVLFGVKDLNVQVDNLYIALMKVDKDITDMGDMINGAMANLA